MRRRRWLTSLLVVTSACGIVDQSNEVSDGWDAIMQEQGAQLLEELARGGSEFEVARMDAGALSAGEAATREFRGANNGFFVLAGICDDNCSDIDLSLVDSAGYSLGADTEPDDFPALDLVTGDETYQYTISMKGCSEGPCEWAVFVARELGSGSPESSGEGMEGWNEQALLLADGYVQRLAEAGERYEMVDIITGRMSVGEESAVDIEGTEGRTHLVVGVCDGDCNDIDLQISSGTGDMVWVDTEPDAVPTVEFVTWEDTYEISMTMHHCAVGPCEWAIIVLRDTGRTP